MHFGVPDFVEWIQRYSHQRNAAREPGTDSRRAGDRGGRTQGSSFRRFCDNAPSMLGQIREPVRPIRPHRRACPGAGPFISSPCKCCRAGFRRDHPVRDSGSDVNSHSLPPIVPLRIPRCEAEPHWTNVASYVFAMRRKFERPCLCQAGVELTR